MQFQLVFLLALIGNSHAQGLPGVICGITGVFCPPTTVTPTTTTKTPTTTTADDTSELCFTVPGALLTQTEIDQVKQLLENSLTNVLGSLGGSINGTLNTLVGGLTGILNPATTPAPTGDGQICVVIHDSAVNQLEAFLEKIISRVTDFFECLQLKETAQINQTIFNTLVNEINKIVPRFIDCVDFPCFLEAAKELYQLILSFPGRFSTYPDSLRVIFNQCVEEATSV